MQYLPGLREAGWRVEVDSLLDDDYLARLYGRDSRDRLRLSAAMLRRAARLASIAMHPPDVLFVQYECLPYVPWLVEGSAMRRFPAVVADYDDAVYEEYRRWPWLRSKIARLMEAATCVIAGNPVLAEYALRHNPKVACIPTVVDLSRYRARQDYAASDTFVAGWIGTPITARFLHLIGDSLRRLARRVPLVLRAVGARPDFTLPGVRVEAIPWSEATEADWIRTFDVGVMPLPDDGFTRGKSGYKLIQYMACGVPVVGSAVGVNSEIADGGRAGLLARDAEEFAAQLERLADSEVLRRDIGSRGRARVERLYSLEARALEFESVLREAAQGGAGR